MIVYQTKIQNKNFDLKKITSEMQRFIKIIPTTKSSHRASITPKT